MCRIQAENVDHLFIHCDFSVNLWWRLLGEFNIFSVIPRGVSDIFLYHVGYEYEGKKKKVLWNCSFLALLWTIWGLRNYIILQDKTSSSDEIWDWEAL